MSNQGNRVLGLDYGTKRIGIAISDPSCTIARGLPTLFSYNLPDTFKKIEEIIFEYNVREVVVGLPLTLKGTIHKAAMRTQSFAEELKKQLELPIHLWDERFTSVMAENSLKAMGVSPSKNRDKIDQISAVLILQSFLDNRKAGGPNE
ncbi:MAG: Holliday junction resolvase RuvX [bacterium]